MLAKIFYKLTLAAAISLASLSAQAVVIIDTGAASRSGAISLSNTQFVGAGFSIGESYSITGISSSLYTSNPGSLTVSLYTDSYGLPGSKLYSQAFDSSSGLSELNWQVTNGSYWVTYEVLNSQTFNGALEFPAERPLQMVVKNDYYTEWTNHGTGLNSFALVISGNPTAPVPEADTSAMLLMGAGVMGFMARRRKQAAV
jgi:hypothetical protein